MNRLTAGAPSRLSASGKIQLSTITARTLSLLQRVLIKLLVSILHLYQYALSPLLGSHCRFHPSCSHYAQQALAAHGLLKGSGLSILRLLKCHPFHSGGYDPVPETQDSRKTSCCKHLT